MNPQDGPFKAWVRAWAPRFLWVLARRIYTYLGRLSLWLRILGQVRGTSFVDSMKLIASAMAAPVTALSELDKWRDPALLFDARVRAGGSTFHCARMSDDLFHVFPSAQLGVRKALGRYLRPGDVFVDAGANIGVFTTFGARQVGPEGRVIAFEMMPGTAARLRDHLEVNGITNTKVIEGALSHRAGETVEAVQPAGSFGQASIARAPGERDATTRLSVQTITLDECLNDVAQIDVMKLDIEGAEPAALRGATACLARTRYLVFEDWGVESEATEIARAAGFSIERLDGNNVVGIRDGS